MKTETTKRDMHMEALIWKSTLRNMEKELACIEKKIYKAKLHLNLIDTKETLDGFSISAKHYSESTAHLQQRIVHFENKLSLINDCDTSECDMDFFDEAEAIFIGVKNYKKKVGILSSEISFYTDSKLSD